MRIGMFTYGMGDNLTGIGIYTRELCIALSRTRPDLEIILINPYPEGKQEFFERFENYRVSGFQKLPLVLAGGPVLLPQLIKKLNLDIFHDPCGISPFLVPRRRQSARRIVSIHDAVSYVYPHVQPLLTRLTFRTFIPAAKWTADAVLAPSESSRYDLVRYAGLPEEIVHVVYPGVTMPSTEELFERKTMANTTLKKWNLHSPYFLYVGALNPRKNVPALVSAFEQVLKYRSDTKLVLVGPKTWWADDALQAAKRFEKHVVVTGYVGDNDLGDLFANAAALVYPSIYEGFGLPPLEAMSFGTPVITSNVSSLPEVVGAAGLMVDPSDVESLANSMIKVLDPLISNELSLKGRIRAREFRWEITAKHTLTVYENTLA